MLFPGFALLRRLLLPRFSVLFPRFALLWRLLRTKRFVLQSSARLLSERRCEDNAQELLPESEVIPCN